LLQGIAQRVAQCGPEAVAAPVSYARGEVRRLKSNDPGAPAARHRVLLGGFVRAHANAQTAKPRRPASGG